MSTQTWEIHTFGSGDYLGFVFNGLASIFSSSQYSVAMQAVTLLAFLGLLLKSAFDREALFNVRWVFAFLFFIFAVYSARVTVTVNDHINPTHNRTIDNVPFGIAFPASFFSSIGMWLTQTFETAFKLPDELNYTQTGFLFGHKLLELSRQSSFTNERLHQNFSDFFSACVIVDGIGHHRFTWEDVMQSPNLVDFFSKNVAQNAAFFRYQYPQSIVNERPRDKEAYLPCREGFANHLKKDIEQDSKQSLSEIFQKSGRFEPKDTTQPVLIKALEHFIGDKPQAFSTQSTLINATANSLMHFAQEVQSQEFLQHYTTLRAEAERKTTYQTVGNIAKEKLPIAKSIIESFIYAIAPIIVLLALLAPLKVSLAYLKVLIWINLWPICYAIIHFGISYHTQQEMALLKSGIGISALQHSKLAEHLSEWVSTSGYLVSSLPLISWMLLSGSGSIAASFVNRVMSGYDTPASKASDEAVSGSGQLAGQNWNMTQSGDIQTSHQNNLGSTITNTASGKSFVEQMTSKSAVGVSLSDSLVQSSKQELASAQQYQSTQSQAMQKATSSALNESSAVMESLQANKGYSENYQHAQSTQQQENNRILENSIDKWAQSQGYEYKKDKEFTNEVKSKVTAGIEGGFSLFGSGVKVGFEGTVGAGVKDTQSHCHSDKYQVANDFIRSEEYAQAIQKISSNTLQFSAQHGYNQTDSETQNLSASLTQQQQAIASYTDALSRTESARESLESMQSFSKTLSINGTDTLKEIATNNGMSISAFDHLLHRASHNDHQAIEDMKFLVTHAEMTQQLTPIDAEAQMQNLEQAYNSKAPTNDAIHAHYQHWKDNVHNSSKVDSGNLNVAYETTKESVIDSLNKNDLKVPNSEKNEKFQSDVEARVQSGRSTQ